MTPYRILVGGGDDWAGKQELRLELIHAAVPHLPGAGVVVVCDPAAPGPGTMAAEWAHDYGLRTETPGGAVPDIVLVFGDSPAPAVAGLAGVVVRRYRLAEAA